MATAAEKAAAKAAQEQAVAADTPTPERFEAVCLRDSAFGNVGEIALLTANEIEAGKAQGAIDDHPEAIAFAREPKGE